MRQLFPQITKENKMKIDFGGVMEDVVTRKEFPMAKAKKVLKNETIAVIGYGAAPMAWWERLLAMAAAGLLIAALPVTDQLGFVLAVVVLLIHWRRARAFPRAAAGVSDAHT